MSTTSYLNNRIMTFGAGFIPCPLRGGQSVHIARCRRCPDMVGFGPVIDNLPSYVACDPTREIAKRRQELTRAS